MIEALKRNGKSIALISAGVALAAVLFGGQQLTDHFSTASKITITFEEGLTAQNIVSAKRGLDYV